MTPADLIARLAAAPEGSAESTYTSATTTASNYVTLTTGATTCTSNVWNIYSRS